MSNISVERLHASDVFFISSKADVDKLPNSSGAVSTSRLISSEPFDNLSNASSDNPKNCLNANFTEASPLLAFATPAKSYKICSGDLSALIPKWASPAIVFELKFKPLFNPTAASLKSTNNPPISFVLTPREEKPLIIDSYVPPDKPTLCAIYKSSRPSPATPMALLIPPITAPAETKRPITLNALLILLTDFSDCFRFLASFLSNFSISRLSWTMADCKRKTFV